MENIEFKTTLVRNPKDMRSDNWQNKCYQWCVSINGVEFDYYTGVGCVIKSKHSLGKDIPKPPTLDDVLYSIIRDYEACEQSFADWCAMCGYDEDSRKALETYLACQNNGEKLRKARIDINEQRARLADY